MMYFNFYLTNIAFSYDIAVYTLADIMAMEAVQTFYKQNGENTGGMDASK